MHRDALDFVMQWTSCGHPSVNQILHHLVLPVDVNPFAARKFSQGDRVPPTAETEEYVFMAHPLAMQAVAHAGLGQQVRRELLQYACHPVDNVFLVAAPPESRNRCPSGAEDAPKAALPALLQ